MEVSWCMESRQDSIWAEIDVIAYHINFNYSIQFGVCKSADVFLLGHPFSLCIDLLLLFPTRNNRLFAPATTMPSFAFPSQPPAPAVGAGREGAPWARAGRGPRGPRRLARPPRRPARARGPLGGSFVRDAGAHRRFPACRDRTRPRPAFLESPKDL